MLCNKDGTPYKPSGSISQFNNNSAQLELFNRWDQESIKRGGSPLYYYEVFISSEMIDSLYRESRDKVWSQFPIELYGFYEPVQTTSNLGGYGLDSPDEVIFELNVSDVLNRLGNGKIPKPGSRIFTPHLRENWELIQVNTGEYKMYGILRYQFICKRWTESLTTGEGRVSQSVPPGKYKIL
jgi:hypothetical protein